jgi:hypothetical protein
MMSTPEEYRHFYFNWHFYFMSLTIWNYAMLALFIGYLIFCQQKSSWLFGHYRIITSLLGKK